ncbi:MAG TPA: deoxyribose-phosphate aldolase [Bryobacteraceae bacterium]|nr:deoxyribose-phosphate aldolase [Bryobacteraceae bacterium]
MDAAELDRLVEQIGEEILARTARYASLPPDAEGLNIADLVCPGCTQRCAQTCEHKAKQIVRAGACRLSCSEKMTGVDPSIAALIDHTLLRPDATREDILKVCREARQYCFASVCINPYWVPLVAAELAGSPVKVCTVIGFPLGATSTEAKVAEAEAALRVGAQEIDMVQNIGALRSGDHDAVRSDIAAVADAGHRAGAVVKVILETAYLDDNQKAMACMLAKMANADFVKTSTGFGPSGATAHDVELMRLAVGPDMGVKASGGIRTLDDLKKMTIAGATRIGASASVKIVEATTGAPQEASSGY